MILSEKQIEMYNNCVFLNEGLFDRKTKQEPNLTQQEFNEMVRQYKEIYSIIMRNIKNSRNFNEYYSEYYEENMKKINQFIRQFDHFIRSNFEKGKVVKVSDHNFTFNNLLDLSRNDYFIDDVINHGSKSNEIKKIVPPGFYVENERTNYEDRYYWSYRYKKYPYLEIYFQQDGTEFIVQPTIKYFLKKN